jgi:glutamate dehydrogenase
VGAQAAGESQGPDSLAAAANTPLPLGPGDLDWQQRALTVALLEFMPDGESSDQGIVRWMMRYEPFVSRWQGMVTELHSGGTDDFVMYTVALRELLDLAQSSALHAHNGLLGKE